MGHCAQCPFKHRPCAPGIGNPNAKVAIVGRNPGRTEALTGEPFTGPSGQLLNATLTEAGLSRDDLWITNAVLCQHEDETGKDCEPPKEAYAACRPRLIEELQRIDPAVVVTLGGEAFQSTCQSQRTITDVQGSMFWVADLNKFVLPAVHPAYILRGSVAAFDDLLAVITRARRLADGTLAFPDPNEQPIVHYCSTFRDTLRGLQAIMNLPEKQLAIDTETEYAVDPEFRILLVQISDGQQSWAFEADQLLEPYAAAVFRSLLTDPSYTWIFHNAQFDLQYIWHHWHVKPACIEDTMALALCLTERGEEVGLKRLSRQWLNAGDYEAELWSYIKKGRPMSDAPRAVLAKYGGQDTIYTKRLYPVLGSLVAEEGNRQLYERILKPAQMAFADMSYHGTQVDSTYIQQLRDEYYPQRDQILADMQQYAADLGFRAEEVKKVGKKDSQLINPGSPKQLKYFFEKYLGLRTDTTDASFIERWSAKYPFIKQLRRYRTLNKMLSTYVDGLAAVTWPDGRVHPDFLLFGTETGRIVIKNPPFQVMPRDGMLEGADFSSIRKLFIASPGYTFIYADYSQLELRVIWHVTGDEEMGKALLSGDFHRAAAAGIFNKPPEAVTKEERVASKLVTFGVAYGRSAWSLANGELQCSVEQAQSFVDAFFNRFPVYAEWWQRTQAEAIETGVLKTEWGRRRRWKLITPDVEKHIRNQAVNFPIQSTASDITMSSLITLNQELRRRNWGYALFTVHDAIAFEVRNECLHEAAALIKDVMSHPPVQPSSAIFAADVEYGPSFGELAEWSA